MANIPGTNITSPVVPFTDADTYPTHDSTYGVGGWREVPDTATRDAIPPLRKRAGMVVYVQGDKPYLWNGSAWVAASIAVPVAATNPYSIAYFLGDTGTPPTSNQNLLRHPISGNLTSVVFAAGLSGSYAGCIAAPTSTFTITIKKANVSVGTITILAGQTTGSFTFSSPVTTSPGDLWDFIAQSGLDGTIAGIYFNISGTRS
jgi:hypothetical protein